MKRIIYIISIILGAYAVFGCTSGIMTYNGDSGIYFAMRRDDASVNVDTTYSETSSVPFIVEPAGIDEVTFRLKVKIIGAVSSHDRQISVRVVEDETTALQEDYEPLQASYILKAGNVFGDIPIVFHRTPSLKGKERSLTLELMPNDDFTLPITMWRNSLNEYVDVTRHTVIVSDKYVQLPGYQTGYFGPFSERKMEVLIEEARIVTLEELKEKMSYVKGKSLGQEFDRYLKKMKAEGNTVYEEDGSEMTAGEYIYN